MQTTRRFHDERVNSEEKIKNLNSRESQPDDKLWVQDKYILEALEKSKSRGKKKVTTGSLRKRMATIGTSRDKFIQDGCSNRSIEYSNYGTNSPLTKGIDGAVERLPSERRQSDVDWWRSKIRRGSTCATKETEQTIETATDTDSTMSENWNGRLHEDVVSVQTTLSEVTTDSQTTMKAVETRVTFLIPDVICLKKTNKRGAFRFLKVRNFWSRTKATK